jgi:hypothetical protein
MCILSGQEDPIIFLLSYGGSKRGGGFEITCAHFSEMADYGNLKLCTMLQYH